MFKYLLIILPLTLLSNSILSQTMKDPKSPTKSSGEPSNEITNQLVISKAQIKARELHGARNNEMYSELKRLNGEIQKYQVDVRLIDKFISKFLSETDNISFPFESAKELFHMQPEKFKQLTDKYFESITAILNYTDKLCLKASKK